MTNDVCHQRTFLWVEINHCGEQVLELIGIVVVIVWVILLPSLPEEIRSVLYDKFVEGVFLTGHFVERLMPTTHAEKNYRERKEVNCLALILVTIENFRGHIHW